MVAINIRVTGIENMKLAVNNLASKIQNPDDKLMRRIGDAMLEDTDRRFMSRGYGTWPPLKPETIKRKKGNSMVLIDSGVMMASTKVQRVGNSMKLTVQDAGRKHDEDVPMYHQEGTKRMPRRKIVEATPQLTSLLAATLTIWIRDMIAAMGKKV